MSEGLHLDDACLSAALDGEAPPLDEAHLHACARCAAALESWRAATLRLGPPPSPAPGQASTAVQAAIARAGELTASGSSARDAGSRSSGRDAGSRSARLRRAMSRPAAAAAAVLVVVAASLGAVTLAASGGGPSQATALDSANSSRSATAGTDARGSRQAGGTSAGRAGASAPQGGVAAAPSPTSHVAHPAAHRAFSLGGVPDKSASGSAATSSLPSLGSIHGRSALVAALGGRTRPRATSTIPAGVTCFAAAEHAASSAGASSADPSYAARLRYSAAGLDDVRSVAFVFDASGAGHAHAAVVLRDNGCGTLVRVTY